MKISYTDKLKRYTSGQADENEKAWVESLFANGENNVILKQMLQEEWDKISDNDSNIEFDHILEKVHSKIIVAESAKWRKPVQKLIRTYMRVAAFIILPLLISGLGIHYFGHHNDNKPVDCSIFSPLGTRVSFTLPDGTTGMLNGGSTLSYSLPFTNNRTVKLEGEAWFEVKHSEDHVFEISAGKSKVAVLGTSFNLSAYPADDFVEVVLQRGKVEFQSSIDGRKTILLPSERLVLKDGKITKSVTDTEKFRAWTEGKLVFRDDVMAEVVRRIERWYNVEIDLTDEELEKYSFHATFNDESLEDVLQFLCMTSPIDYKIIPHEQQIDGTINKEHVIISFKK